MIYLQRIYGFLFLLQRQNEQQKNHISNDNTDQKSEEEEEWKELRRRRLWWKTKMCRRDESRGNGNTITARTRDINDLIISCFFPVELFFWARSARLCNFLLNFIFGIFKNKLSHLFDV